MYFRPPRGHKILESHKICSSVINLGKKSLILGKVIKNHKISVIHFSGKENCSVWTVLDCSFEEVSVKCWPQTPEHGDIVTVLIHNYYYLQTVNTTSDCTLSFVEFGLCLAPKANQGRQGPTITITLTRYWNLILCLLLSYLVWILISIVGCSISRWIIIIIIIIQIDQEMPSTCKYQKAWEKDCQWVSSVRTDPQSA